MKGSYNVHKMISICFLLNFWPDINLLGCLFTVFTDLYFQNYVNIPNFRKMMKPKKLCYRSTQLQKKCNTSAFIELRPFSN